MWITEKKQQAAVAPFFSNIFFGTQKKKYMRNERDFF